MKRVAIASVVAVILAGALTTQTVATYYDDAHYSLTYYLARSCGFTPLQAHRVASADVSIDYSTLTEPIQALLHGTNYAKGDRGTITPYDPKSSWADVEEPRVRFHAMRDERVGGTAANADAAIHVREAPLRQLGMSQQNPGVLLHFLQDELPHAGYASVGGHWIHENYFFLTDNAHVPLADLGLPYGATSDYLSHKPTSAFGAARTTLQELTAFMDASSPFQRPVPCDLERASRVLDRLFEVNPVAEVAATFARGVDIAVQYIKAGGPQIVNLFSARVGSLASEMAKAIDGAPSKARADEVVELGLLNNRDIRPYPAEPIHYQYDARGSVAATALDSFTLYGTVRARLQGLGAGKAMPVSVWTLPTRGGEEPYQLSCQVTSDVATFPKMPVGDLMVRAVTAEGTVITSPLLFETLQRDVTIEVPQANRGDTCGKETSKLAADLCSRTTNGRPASLPDVRRLESQLEAQIETCRPQVMTTRNAPAPAPQPAPPPQKQGGGKARKIATGAAVAVGAGAGAYYLADAIEKAVDNGATSGGGTTGGATTGGGTTGGGTTNNARCSTRNCTVNFLSGTCTCTGATSAVCPSTNIQTQVNGACFVGTYCAEGLSCNNQRCEGPTGQCRF